MSRIDHTWDTGLRCPRTRLLVLLIGAAAVDVALIVWIIWG